MRPDHRNLLETHLSPSDRNALIRLLAKHRLILKPALQLELPVENASDETTTAESFATRIAFSAAELHERYAQDAIRLLLYAEKIHPGSPLLLSVMAIYQLHLGANHEAVRTAGKAHAALFRKCPAFFRQPELLHNMHISPERLSRIMKEARTIMEGRITLGAYRALLTPEAYEHLAETLRSLHGDSFLFDHLEDEALPCHPSTAHSLADEILEAFLERAPSTRANDYIHYQMLSLASVLDPYRADIPAHAALGIYHHAQRLLAIDSPQADALYRTAATFAQKALRLFQSRTDADFWHSPRGEGSFLSEAWLERLQAIAQHPDRTLTEKDAPLSAKEA